MEYTEADEINSLFSVQKLETLTKKKAKGRSQDSKTSALLGVQKVSVKQVEAAEVDGHPD